MSSRCILMNTLSLYVVVLFGKIQSHEMFLIGEIKPPQAKKNKRKPPPSSSSDDEASNDLSNEDEEEDTKLALLMRKTTKMLSKLNKKGYNYDPKKNEFRT